MAAAIFVVALTVRLAHLWQMRQAPVFSVLMGDARGYDEWARRIAGGDWLGADVFYQAPLYPYFLGAVYTTLGHSLLAARIVQAVIGAAACLLLGLAAERVFSRRAGWVAGLGLAVYAPAIFFDALIQKTVLDVLFVCLAMWMLSRLIELPASAGVWTAMRPETRVLYSSGDRMAVPAARSAARDTAASQGFCRDIKGRALDWLGLGLAIGGLTLTRENALVLAAVVLVWIALRGRGELQNTTRPPRRRAEAAAFVLGLALVLVPVAVRNYAVGGGFYLTTSQFGPNFYIGNNARSDGTYAPLRPGRGAPEYERQDATELAGHALGRSLTPSEVSSYWTDRALGFITSRPGAWIALLGRKFLLLWNADEMLDTESQETHAESSTLLRVGAWFGHFGLLVPLAVVGLIATWRERERLWIFHAMAIAYAASVIVFYVFARYRFPLVPFLMLFASAGIVRGAAFIRARSPAGRVALAVTAVAVAIFANWPVLSPALMRAVTENNMAAALQEDGRLDDAIDHYRRAIAIKSDYAPAYNNMGTALRATGHVDEAVAAYHHAIETMPDYADAHYNLANALLEQNRGDEATAHLLIAARTLPMSAGVHNNLGKALADKGRLEEAASELGQAVALDPRSAKAHRNLGNVLASQGRVEEALSHLRRAVEIEPSDAESGYDLGTLLLEARRLDEAVVVFEAVLRNRPDYAEAHNNLGIALGSQGNLPEAIAHFEDALRIEPGFVDARRNLETARRVPK